MNLEIFMSAFRSVYLPHFPFFLFFSDVCLAAFLSYGLSVCLSIYSSACLSICINLPVCLTDGLPVYRSACLSVSPSVYQSAVLSLLFPPCYLTSALYTWDSPLHVCGHPLTPPLLWETTLWGPHCPSEGPTAPLRAHGFVGASLTKDTFLQTRPRAPPSPPELLWESGGC